MSAPFNVFVGDIKVLSGLTDDGGLRYKGQAIGGIQTYNTLDDLPTDAQTGDLALVLRGSQLVAPLMSPIVNCATIIANPSPQYLAPLWELVENAYKDAQAEYEEIDDPNKTYSADDGITYYARSGEEGSYTYTAVENLSNGDSVYGLYVLERPHFVPPLDFFGGIKGWHGKEYFIPVVEDADDNFYTQRGFDPLPFFGVADDPTSNYCLGFVLDSTKMNYGDLDGETDFEAAHLSFYAWEPLTVVDNVTGEEYELHAGWNHYVLTRYEDEATPTVTSVPTGEIMRIEVGTKAAKIGDSDQYAGLLFVDKEGNFLIQYGVFSILLSERPNGLYRFDGTAWHPMPNALNPVQTSIDPPEDEDDEEDDEE